MGTLDDALWGDLEQAINKSAHSNIYILPGATKEEYAKISTKFVVKIFASYQGCLKIYLKVVEEIIHFTVMDEYFFLLY